MQLRDYQHEDILAAERDLYQRGMGGTLIHHATGLGKTFLSASLINKLFDLNKQRIMFVVHRENLVMQTYLEYISLFPEWKSNSYTKYGYPGVGIVMGKYNQPNARIVIGTPQTLSSVEGVTDRLEEILKYGSVDLMILDEAHYSASKSYIFLAKRVAEDNPKTKRLGLTATPFRNDGLSLRHPLSKENPKLGNLFDTICATRNIRWGIDNGYLSPLRPPLLIETNIELPEGDGDVEERAKLIQAKNWAELVVKAYIDYGESRIGAWFLPTVNHSKIVREEFANNGILAAHVDGECIILPDGTEIYGEKAKDERRKLYKRVETERIQLCNYDVLTHGFNLPRLDLIGLARPSESPIFVTQAIGRITRLHKDKEDGLILDLALSGIPIMLSGTLTGCTWDDKEKKYVPDEVVIEDLLPSDLRDVRKEKELVNADGLTVRIGSLFKDKLEAWHYGSDSMSLSLSDKDILYISIPNYSLARDVFEEGLERGLKFLAEHPGHQEAEDYYMKIKHAHHVAANYTLWHVRKNASNQWYVHNKSFVAKDGSVELVFDYALPLIARFEEPQLAKKKKAWRKQPVSKEQLDYLKRLGYNNGVPINKGEASKNIAHCIAHNQVQKLIEHYYSQYNEYKKEMVA